MCHPWHTCHRFAAITGLGPPEVGHEPALSQIHRFQTMRITDIWGQATTPGIWTCFKDSNKTLRKTLQSCQTQLQCRTCGMSLSELWAPNLSFSFAHKTRINTFVFTLSRSSVLRTDSGNYGLLTRKCWNKPGYEPIAFGLDGFKRRFMCLYLHQQYTSE